MKKVAIYGKIHKDGIEFLKKNNFKVLNIEGNSQKKIIKNLKNVDAIAVRTGNLDEKILKECHNLKIVSRHGVGYDNIDINFLNSKKIALAITGTSNASSVSEHVMTMFLYLCKQINVSDDLVRRGFFSNKSSLPNFFELYKKNILIIGFGRIGQALAKRCLGFESKIYVHDPYVKNILIKKHKCHPISFNRGLKIADFISIHMPLNYNTKNLIAKKQLSLMKKNCIIVNTSRGGIVREKDLVWALKNNKIFGAGLDVFEKEPPDKSNPLLKIKNVVLTPHNAALTLECRKRMSRELCENIVFYLNNNKKLVKKNIVNKIKIKS